MKKYYYIFTTKYNNWNYNVVDEYSLHTDNVDHMIDANLFHKNWKIITVDHKKYEVLDYKEYWIDDYCPYYANQSLSIKDVITKNEKEVYVLVKEIE